ncbi:hypothetical protein BT69DRAFT_1280835, partial [Atractiella rhizophila]
KSCPSPILPSFDFDNLARDTSSHPLSLSPFISPTSPSWLAGTIRETASSFSNVFIRRVTGGIPELRRRRVNSWKVGGGVGMERLCRGNGTMGRGGWIEEGYQEGKEVEMGALAAASFGMNSTSERD